MIGGMAFLMEGKLCTVHVLDEKFFLTAAIHNGDSKGTVELLDEIVGKGNIGSRVHENIKTT